MKDIQRVKYSRTRHLAASRGYSDDDKIASQGEADKYFAGRRVIISEKMDGESATIYPDGYTHARSLDSGPHPSRTVIRALAGQVGYLLDSGMRVCGENMYAQHSIRYTNLPAYFLVYNIWQDNLCLNWDATQDWCEKLSLHTVPVIYDGLWQGENAAVQTWLDYTQTLGKSQLSEGFVVRLADEFLRDEFANYVYKFVRENHVGTTQHWMHQEITPNELREASR